MCLEIIEETIHPIWVVAVINIHLTVSLDKDRQTSPRFTRKLKSCFDQIGPPVVDIAKRMDVFSCQRISYDRSRSTTSSFSLTNFVEDFSPIGHEMRSCLRKCDGDALQSICMSFERGLQRVAPADRFIKAMIRGGVAQTLL